MCLLYLNWLPGTSRPLTVAANRDEFFNRPSIHMKWWDEPKILAGQDATSHGTWLALHINGQFAVITNGTVGLDELKQIHKKRKKTRTTNKSLSRGSLVVDYFLSGLNAHDYSQHVLDKGDEYENFNLIVIDTVTHPDAQAWWVSNTSRELITPGVHGLSNDILDGTWTKITSGLPEFTKLSDAKADPDEFLPLMQDRTLANKKELDPAQYPGASSRFVVLPGYGTQVTTALAVTEISATIVEQNYLEGGQAAEQQQFFVPLEISPEIQQLRANLPEGHWKPEQAALWKKEWGEKPPSAEGFETPEHILATIPLAPWEKEKKVPAEPEETTDFQVPDWGKNLPEVTYDEDLPTTAENTP